MHIVCTKCYFPLARVPGYQAMSEHVNILHILLEVRLSNICILHCAQ